MNQGHQTQPNEYHSPVMADEVAELLSEVSPGVVVDATFGGGGHSRNLRNRLGRDVEIIAIDRDPDAELNAAGIDVQFVLGNFADITSHVRSVTDGPVSGVLFDFGVSSHQLDQPERGFSYRSEGPLDMRMGPDARHTADEIVNNWDEADLARIIRRFGDEPMARRIAKAIVSSRPIDSTAALSTIIADAMPAARRRVGHPARRTFQAIRMAVNSELDAISEGLEGAVDLLETGGRVVAISYHSLEDRVVKRTFNERATGCTCPPDLPVCGCGNTAELRILTRKPLRPGEEEVAANNRARSALLRAAEKVAA